MNSVTQLMVTMVKIESIKHLKFQSNTIEKVGKEEIVV